MTAATCTCKQPLSLLFPKSTRLAQVWQNTKWHEPYNVLHFPYSPPQIQKWCFYRAKAVVLPRKSGAFSRQKHRFYKPLSIKELYKRQGAGFHHFFSLWIQQIKTMHCRVDIGAEIRRTHASLYCEIAEKTIYMI